MQLREQKPLTLYTFLERYSEAYKKEMESFISAQENKSSVPVNGDDGLQSLLIGLAAIKSYQEKDQLI